MAKYANCTRCSHFEKTNMLWQGIHGKCLEKDEWVRTYIKYCRKYEPLDPKGEEGGET